MNISKEEYERLKVESTFLEALREAGVDNWSGYEYALEIYQELMIEANDEHLEDYVS